TSLLACPWSRQCNRSSSGQCTPRAALAAAMIGTAMAGNGTAAAAATAAAKARNFVRVGVFNTACLIVTGAAHRQRRESMQRDEPPPHIRHRFALRSESRCTGQWQTCQQEPAD